VSVLVDKEIRRLCKGPDDVTMIRPFDERRLQPASYDVCLGTSFKRVDKTRLRPVDLAEPHTFKDLYTDVQITDDESLTISPKGFVLACTMERVFIPPCVVGRIDGKSSLARLGLVIENAGYLDCGFRGRITLEIYNQLPVPIILHPGLSIAQLSFETTTGRPDRLYGNPELNSHYQDDDEATGSRYGS